MSIKMVDQQTGELLPVPRNLPSELFLDFDRRDEAQIEAELLGGVVEEYAYRFDQGGQTVTGLSLAGVMAVAQNMGGITCDEAPRWEITEDDYYCEIAATDHGRGLKFWGNASQPKFIRRRDGIGPLDPHARAKALSKAQRNAIRKLIPETLATKMLQAYLDGQQPQQRRPLARPRKQMDYSQGAETPLTSSSPATIQPGNDEGLATEERQRRREIAETIAMANNALTPQHVGWAENRAKRAGIVDEPDVAAALEAARRLYPMEGGPTKEQFQLSK